MKNIKKSLLFLAIIPVLAVTSQTASAKWSIGSPPKVAIPSGIGLDFYPTATYWSTCWRNVTNEEFTKSALADVEDIKVVHNMDYHVPVMDQDNENTSEYVRTFENGTNTIVAALGQSYASLAEARSTIGKNLLTDKLEYMRHLTEAGVNEKEFGFFNDGNGVDGNINKNAQSYSYFKNTCKRNKMFAKAGSPSHNIEKSSQIATEVIKATTQSTQNGSIASQGKTKVATHFEKWCSKEEIQNGLCDTTELTACNNASGVCKAGEEFKLVNGDTNAVNVLNPEGWKDHNSIPDELFTTKYTYDKDQEEAANDFAYNAVYSGSIAAPSVKEKGDPTKAEFVTAYNSNLAALNLAHFTFQNLIASRKPITEEGDAVMMSELDVVHYIMHNMKDPDNLATVMAGKEKTMDLAMFTMLTVKNKLEFNRYEQNQRIETLLGAILAKVATSPTNQVYANDLIK